MDSVDPWGVGVGSNGMVYVLTSRFDGTLQPGLWSAAMTPTGAIGTWEPVIYTKDVASGQLSDYLWAGTESRTWTGVQSDAGGDLSELTVVPGTPDEIFVGEGRNGDGYGLAGYFRYGKYSVAGADKIGWAHIHRTNYTWPYTAIRLADWKNGDIHDAPLETSMRAGSVTIAT